MCAMPAQQAVVVGILLDQGQAHKTVDDLRSAGFSGSEIGTACDDGEMVVQENALARADVAGNGLLEALVGMGVPELDARACERDFAARRTVVTVQTSDRASEAVRILRRNHAATIRRWAARTSPHG